MKTKEIKSSAIFWGVFFISIGGLLLLNQIDAVGSMGDIVRFWPVLLVLIGISLLNLPEPVKKILAGLSGLFLALIIFGIFTFQWNKLFFWNEWDDDSGKHDTEYYDTVREPQVLQLDSGITSAKLKIEAGAMSMSFGGETAELLVLNPVESIIGMDIYHSVKNGRAFAELEMNPEDIHFGKKNKTQRANIKLNPDIPWDIDIEIGASSLDADLSDYIMEKIDIKAGAASLELKLGSKSKKTGVEIDGGAMSLKIYVPKEAGVKLHVDSFLNSNDIEGFISEGGGDYVTSDFSDTKNKIFINIDGALASIKVKRY